MQDPTNQPTVQTLSWSRLSGPIVQATLLLSMLAIALSGITPKGVSAQDEKEAEVVVQLDEQGSIIRHIVFSQEISGLLALQQSGLDVITTETDFGAAVCSIEGVGCPADNCFCGGNNFWNYSYWDGSTWQSYPVGAGSSVITKTGAVEGWRWGEFGVAQVPYTTTQAAGAALPWLMAQQVITSGDFGGLSSSLDVMIALGANNQDADGIRGQSTISNSGPSLAGYIRLNSAAYSRSIPGAAGKLAVAVAAVDACLPAAALTPGGYYSPTLGTYSLQDGANTWSILGSVAISESVPVTAVNTLRGSQLANGGWEWGPTWGADTNSTALAIQALIAVGEPISSSEIVSAVAFLETTQQEDGGFPYSLSDEATRR